VFPHDTSLSQTHELLSLRAASPVLTIEHALQCYLQELQSNGRKAKTIEWHQTALGPLRQYLVNERHLCLLASITEHEMRSWVAFLQTALSAKDTTRSVGTIATYARSVRAFCHWLVRNGYLEQSPFVKGIIPKAGNKTMRLIDAGEFDRLLLACRAGGGLEPLRERLGLCDLTALKRYEWLSGQQGEGEDPKELTEELPSRPPSARTASKRHRRRSTAATKEAFPDRQLGASRSGGSPRNSIIGSAQDDP